MSPHQALSDGRKAVTTAGTRVPLDASLARIGKVTITAEETNTGIIVVGGATVVAAVGTRRGTPLRARDVAEVDVNQLTDVYLDSTVNGEGVTFTVEGP